MGQVDDKNLTGRNGFKEECVCMCRWRKAGQKEDRGTFVRRSWSQGDWILNAQHQGWYLRATSRGADQENPAMLFQVDSLIKNQSKTKITKPTKKQLETNKPNPANKTPKKIQTQHWGCVPFKACQESLTEKYFNSLLLLCWLITATAQR